MGKRVDLDEGYYVEESKADSLWVIYRTTGESVGNFTLGGGPSWTEAMTNEDKGRIANLLMEKVG